MADPAAQLLRLVTDLGDPAPAVGPTASQAEAELIRRRFGLALPPPYAGLPAEAEPVRVAAAVDGAAIAAVKWRCFGTSYRGILEDGFLDSRDIVPPATYWQGRAMVPPSRRHRLLVCGRPGRVFGYADLCPVHPEDADPEHPEAGEVAELYVDPSAQGAGIGGRLLEAAEEWFRQVGWRRAELSTMANNLRARAFYGSRGWEPTGRVRHEDLGVVAFDEVRLARIWE